jgi:hypothetical protein
MMAAVVAVREVWVRLPLRTLFDLSILFCVPCRRTAPAQGMAKMRGPASYRSC